MDAVDQSWGRIDPQKAKAAGVKLVMGYLSWDVSKNWTPDWVRRYLSAGIACGFNWEAVQRGPLNGANQGKVDATEACRQLKAIVAAVGTPSNKLAIIFSVDFDTDPGQYDTLGAYFSAAMAVCHANGFLCGAYGEADLIEWLYDNGHIDDIQWQTLAWSRGRISPETDLYQSSINNTVANSSVDLNTIIHAGSVGAWWPAGSGEAASGGGVEIGSDELSKADVDAIIAYVDKKGDAIVSQIHQDLSGTMQREVQDLALAVKDDDVIANIVLRVAQIQGLTNETLKQVQQLVANPPAAGSSGASASDVAAEIGKRLSNG